jgi:hypothetical protein
MIYSPKVSIQKSLNYFAKIRNLFLSTKFVGKKNKTVFPIQKKNVYLQRKTVFVLIGYFGKRQTVRQIRQSKQGRLYVQVSEIY